MKIFTDFHHASLLHSLILLFEKRMGGQVYRPIGREWFDRGYWRVYDHPATVEQFLGVGGATPDGTPELNKVNVESWGLYYCHDIDSGKENKACTYDWFMSHDFDIIIASIPDHIERFRKLADSHPSKPKLIYQVGNHWDIPDMQESLVDGIMASAKLNKVPSKPYIEYHQEFDLSIFHTPLLEPEQNITSLVNCFDTQDHFREDFQLFETVRAMMPEWNFKVMGGGCRDGAAHGSREVSRVIQESRFLWHTKQGGDGYGHIVHNAGAVGTPLIVKKEYYLGKLAEPLLIDGETCITIDGLSPMQIKEKIERYNEQDRYYHMRRRARQVFDEVVNFDKEFEKIKNFIHNL